MTNRLRANSNILYQLKLLGQLAARLENDPRNAVDVIPDFLGLTRREHEIFIKAYMNINPGDDPLEVS